MRYRIISVGKVREPYIAAAIADFRRRLQRYDSLEELEVPPARGDRPADAMLEEAESIVALVDKTDLVWLLERTGVMLSSRDIAARMQELEGAGRSKLTIVIAGTYGAGKPLLARAGLLWSLGPLTYLHEWAHAIVLEQLYRAAKINRNEPYHH